MVGSALIPLSGGAVLQAGLGGREKVASEKEKEEDGEIGTTSRGRKKGGGKKGISWSRKLVEGHLLKEIGGGENDASENVGKH